MSFSLKAPPSNLCMETDELEQGAAILPEHLPEHLVRVFGSGARGNRAKRYSDLDLAIKGAELSFAAMGRLVRAFDESRLPFKVDIVEMATVAPDFRERIEKDKVLLQTPGGGTAP